MPDGSSSPTSACRCWRGGAPGCAGPAPWSPARYCRSRRQRGVEVAAAPLVGTWLYASATARVFTHAYVMPHVTAHVPVVASQLAVLVREHLDALCTYATHLVGDGEDAIEFVAAGIHHATRYPPARIEADGRVALY